MHLLYCDESNIERRAGDFLVYGGIFIPSEQAGSLSGEIERIRVDAGLSPEVRLKFNPRPEGFTHQEFITLKQRIIEASIEHECKFLAYVVLHDLAGVPDNARRFGINTVCYHFHCVLNRVGGSGLVLIDRFNDANNEIDAHLKQKMNVGIQLPYRNAPTRLTNITGFHYSAIGQSHFTSLVDIFVGSFRFAVNIHTRNDERLRENGLTVLRVLAPAFYRYPGGDRVPDIGLCFSPMNVRLDHFREKYRSLQAFMREGGVDSSQRIGRAR